MLFLRTAEVKAVYYCATSTGNIPAKKGDLFIITGLGDEHIQNYLYGTNVSAFIGVNVPYPGSGTEYSEMAAYCTALADGNVVINRTTSASVMWVTQIGY